LSEDSLEPLITQCPTCRTRFRVTEAQLNVAGGRVRCGACLSVFAGVEHLVLGAGPRLRPGESPNEALDALLDELRAETPPAKPRAELRAAEPARDEVRPGRAERASRTRGNPLASDARADDAAAEVDAAIDGDVAGESDDEGAASNRNPEGGAPRAADELHEPRRDARVRTAEPVAEPEPPPGPTSQAAAEPSPAANVALALGPEDLMERPRRRRRWWIPLALALGAVLFAAQVLYFQFDAWARNPDVRPVYEWLCPRLHCQLPVMRSLDDIRSKNLVVRANPDVPGQLMVDALIVNQARFAQPFPVIELRFSSMDGRPIAARRFTPEEYLAGELKGATMFAPLTPVHIAFAIDDPGTDAVSYYIQFR
jgi:predicted Zn finger-like uncharacterized protein